jgi:alkylation response protein AidB-like acyl-CoA dehydrogenase
MDFRLTPEDLELQERARDFTERVLIPLELECEEHDGLTPESFATAKQAVLDAGFNAINHAERDGGQGFDVLQQIVVEEQWGRATGALWDIPWRPSIPLAHATADQKERYLLPACRGERRDAYAITEEHAGSDPSMVRTTARRDGDAWVLDGTKWHVTSGDVADFFLVHAHVDADPAKATVFLVDKDLPGVRLVRTPKYSHTFVFEHPIFAFEGVRVGADAVLGDVGAGYELTKDWFVEERIMIGARTVGAATRALDLSLSFARERVQFGQPIVGFQAVEFMLADMAAQIMAAKSMLYRVGWQASIARSCTRSRPRSSSCVRRRRAGWPTPRCRSTAAAATCASSRSNACGVSSGSTGSGRAHPRSSGSSSATSSESAVTGPIQDGRPNRG